MTLSGTNDKSTGKIVHVFYSSLLQVLLHWAYAVISSYAKGYKTGVSGHFDRHARTHTHTHIGSHTRTSLAGAAALGLCHDLQLRCRHQQRTQRHRAQGGPHGKAQAVLDLQIRTPSYPRTGKASDLIITVGNCN